MKTTSGDLLPSSAAIGAALVGLLYSVAFVVLQNGFLAALALMLGGVLSLVALSALFSQLRSAESSAPVLGLILAAAGALGAAVHGAYDLANVINSPSTNAAALAGLPSQIDPRGFLTFGLAGLALLVAASLMARTGRAAFPPGFIWLTYALAALLIIVYLGRLIVLSPASPLVLAPAALTGFLLNPLWYAWLGVLFRREVAANATGSQAGPGGSVTPRP